MGSENIQSHVWCACVAIPLNCIICGAVSVVLTSLCRSDDAVVLFCNIIGIALITITDILCFPEFMFIAVVPYQLVLV